MNDAGHGMSRCCAVFTTQEADFIWRNLAGEPGPSWGAEVLHKAGFHIKDELPDLGRLFKLGRVVSRH